MNHTSRYVIPDFQLREYIQAEYGYDMKRGSGNSYYCQCPIHDDHTPPSEKTFRVWDYPSETGQTPPHGGWICPRDRSQFKGGAWDFLTEVEGFPGPRDPGFDETLEHLADTLDRDLVLKEDHEVTAADQGRRLLRDVEARLLEIEFPEANDHYYQGQNGQWLYRGRPPLQWLSAGVGMLTEADLRELEDTHSEEAFEAAGFFEMGRLGYDYLTQGVVFMRPSYTGSPVGWGVRRYEELGARDSKYLKNANSELLNDGDYLFGLDKAERSDSPVLYIVEGEMDCLALRLRGAPPVIAIGSSVPTRKQAQRISQLGVHPVFVLDADSQKQGFHHAAEIAKLRPDADFMPLTGDLDPDSFVQEESVAALLEMPRYTSLEAEMFDEDAYDFTEGRWTREQIALARKYMEDVVADPFISNEDEVRTISELAGLEEEFLKSWLFQERNQRAARRRPDPVDWSSGGSSTPR
jgi:DNA primase